MRRPEILAADGFLDPIQPGLQASRAVLRARRHAARYVHVWMMTSPRKWFDLERREAERVLARASGVNAGA